MKRLVVAGAATLLAVTSLSGEAVSQSASGRLTSSLYAFEQQLTDSTSANHVRAFQVATVRVEELGHRNLSVRAYARGQGDWDGSVDDRQTFRVYHLYAEWKDQAHGLDLKLGRQRLFAGVANVAIDGGWASLKLGGQWQVEGFAGVQPQRDYALEVRRWNSHRAFGGRVRTEQLNGDLSVSVSGMRSERRPDRYVEPGQFTERLIRLPAAQQELYGVDAAYRVRPGATLYHQFEYDRLRSDVQRVSGALSLALPGARWSLDGEFIHRAPSLDRNSVLSVFSHGDYDEIGLRGGYVLRPGWRAHGSAAWTGVEDDSAQRFSAGITRGNVSVTYSRRTGYGGESDAVSGGYAKTWRQTTTVRVTTGLTSYKINDAQDGSNTSWTLVVGAQQRVRRNLAIDLEMQNLTQDIETLAGFPGTTYDLRSLIKVSYWFNAGRGKRGLF